MGSGGVVTLILQQLEAGDVQLSQRLLGGSACQPPQPVLAGIPGWERVRLSQAATSSRRGLGSWL